MIRAARGADLPVMREIEVAAGAAFADVGMPEIAADEPPSIAELSEYLEAGRAWVFEVDGRPVGYLIADLVDGTVHIEQVSVRPEVRGRGIGRALIEHAGVPATLTTFAEVPWNAPYYERLGFRVLAELTPGLVAIRREEAARGLDRWPRVVMRRSR